MDMSVRFPNLGLEIPYLGTSVRIFGFEITYCGILIAVGMLLGLSFVILEAKRNNENQDMYLGMFILSLITGIIGARLFYAAFYWDVYKDNVMQIFNIRGGGMSFYGGLFGGILGAALFCGIKKLHFMKMADTASIGILTAQIIGRWGNLFNRESFGEYTGTALAMQLPLSSVRTGEVTAAMRENLVTVNGVSYIQVHPVFLYESAWCLLLLLLILVWKRKKRFQGEVFLRYLTGYGLGRFFFEWLRTDKIRIPGTPVSVSQVISAVLFVVCGIVLSVRRTMAKKRAEVRKRRREEAYEAEEKAAYQADTGAEIVSENQKNAEEAGSPDSKQEGSAEESQDEPQA